MASKYFSDTELIARIKRKWSIKKTFTTPIQYHKKKG